MMTGNLRPSADLCSSAVDSTADPDIHHRHVAATTRFVHRELIERVRLTNKLLSLYVLALQEDRTLTTDERQRLAQTLRRVADEIEQRNTQTESVTEHRR